MRVHLSWLVVGFFRVKWAVERDAFLKSLAPSGASLLTGLAGLPDGRP